MLWHQKSHDLNARDLLLLVLSIRIDRPADRINLTDVTVHSLDSPMNKQQQQQLKRPANGLEIVSESDGEWTPAGETVSFDTLCDNRIEAASAEENLFQVIFTVCDHRTILIYLSARSPLREYHRIEQKRSWYSLNWRHSFSSFLCASIRGVDTPHFP